MAILQLVAGRRGLAALPAWAVAPWLERGREAGAERAFVADFIATVKRASFVCLPGIRPPPRGPD